MFSVYIHTHTHTTLHFNEEESKVKPKLVARSSTQPKWRLFSKSRC